MRSLLILTSIALLAVPRAPAVTRVPFTWTPGQIEVGVRVDGAPATVLLDTGSEFPVVSSRLASRLTLQTFHEHGRDFAEDVEIDVGTVKLPDQRVMVMPFDTYYARGRAIDGVIGYDLFAQFTVAIDFGARALTMWRPSAFLAPKGVVTVPLTFAGRLPVVEAAITPVDRTSVPVRLVVDTGASQAIILRYPFANEHGLLDVAGQKATIAPSLAAGELRLVDVRIEQVKVGAWTFDRPSVLAHAEPRGSGAYTATDGLIGNTLLSRFTLFVDYPRKRLLLQPARNQSLIPRSPIRNP
jgi:predicted aspartyl protease